MIAIITDDKDLAGMNIKERLLSNFPFKISPDKYDDYPVYKNGDIFLYTSRTETIHCENIDRKIPAELFIFATKHRSAAEIKTLSIHAPGNWDKNELGGEEKKICMAPALFMKIALKNLAELSKGMEYQVSLEVTHHGPFLEIAPCCYIEIGSTENQWKDDEAGICIAKTIIKSIADYRGIKEKMRSAIGIGGGHYAPYFNKLQLEQDFAIGHILPKYALSHVDEQMLRTAMISNAPKASFALIDEKGMGDQKQRIIGLLEKLNIRFEKCRKL